MNTIGFTFNLFLVVSVYVCVCVCVCDNPSFRPTKSFFCFSTMLLFFIYKKKKFSFMTTPSHPEFSFS